MVATPSPSSSPVRSVAVVAHPDDRPALLSVEPGPLGAGLALVLVTLPRVATADGPVGEDPVVVPGPWTVHATLAADPRVARAAALARTDADLVVLVDGITPEPGWLAALVAAFDDDPDLGAAQPLVVDPSGTTLRHAGGVLFRDGTVLAYGAGDRWPDAPQYGCRRHVDALAPSCLALRGPLARSLPADLVDGPGPAGGAALAVAVRRTGARTLLEPAVRVRTTSAASERLLDDTDDAARSWLRAVCTVELAHQPEPVEDRFDLHALAHTPQGGFGPGEVLRHDWIASRTIARHARRIWMIDPCTLTYDRDTGHLRAYRVVEDLRAQGHQVLYWANWGGFRDEYVPALSRLGVMSWGVDTDLLPGQADADAFIATFRPTVAELALRHPADLVWISFHHLVPTYLTDLRAALPGVPVVLDTVDVHHVREAREAEVLDDDDLRAAAGRTRRWELASCAAVDAVICVTDDDAAVLRAAIPGIEPLVVSVVNAPEDPGPGFEARHGLFFVASFVPTPNADALRWYRDEIQPRVDARCDARGIPRIPLTVAGNDPSGIAAGLAGPGIDVVGRIPEVLPYLHRARVSIAPLRWGAGIKGKVCEALAAGLPVVGTTVAFEGLGAVDGDHGLIADDADAFADAIVRLHEDRDQWERIRAVAPPHVDDLVGLGRLRRSLGPVLDVRARPARPVDVEPVAPARPAVPGRISVVVHADDDPAELRACLVTLRHGAEGDIEVVVVDDAAVPPVDGVALGPLCDHVVRLDDRVGYARAVDAALPALTGEHVLVLGAEALVGPGWAAAIRRSLAEPTVVALGPRANIGAGRQRSDLATCRSDRDLVLTAGSIQGWTGDLVAEVALLHPSVVAVRRDELAAVAGRTDGADPFPRLTLMAETGRRSVVVDGFYAHHQHAGPARLAARPRPTTAPIVPALAAVVVGADAAGTIVLLSASLDGIVAERVWVDTGSTDATRALARALGWTVVDGTTVADPRALGLAQVSTPWVVDLEPEELLVVRDRTELIRALAASDAPERCDVVTFVPPSSTAYGPIRVGVTEPRLRRRAAPAGDPVGAPPAPLVTALAVERVVRRVTDPVAHALLADLLDPADPEITASARVQAAAALAPTMPGLALDLSRAVAAEGAPDDPVVRAARALATSAALRVDPSGAAVPGPRATADDAHVDALATAAARLHAGDGVGALAVLDRIPARPDPLDVPLVAVHGPALRALAERAAGHAGAWPRLVELAGSWGPVFPRWDALVTGRPPAVAPRDVLTLAAGSRALHQVLDAVAAVAPRELVGWLRTACSLLSPTAQHQFVTDALLGSDPSGDALQGLTVDAVLAAGAEAIVRRVERAHRRLDSYDRAVTVLAVADGGVDRCLAWLEALVEVAGDDQVQLVAVDNGSRDDTAALLACLEGDVAVLRLPVRAHTGPALLAGTTLARGRTAVVTSMADPLDAALVAAVVDGHRRARATADGTHVVVPSIALTEAGVLDGSVRAVGALAARLCAAQAPSGSTVPPSDPTLPSAVPARVGAHHEVSA